MTLHSYVNGAWHTRSVATERASESLGSGYSANYSAYTITLKPALTTKYYFSYGKARSPQTTITVKQAPQPTPSPTPSPSPTASPAPAPSGSAAPAL